MAQREVIVLDVLPGTGSQGGQIQVRAVLWLPMTGTRMVPSLTNFSSQATAVDQTTEQPLLNSGAIREEVITDYLPSSYTTAEVKAWLQRRYADRLAFLLGAPSPRQYYGVSWDGTAWSA